jgi:hypothetical protein
MRLGVTRPLGINVGGTQMPTTQIDLYLNRAFWEIQNKFPFREKDVISTFFTIEGVRNYDVSFPTEAVRHIAIVRDDDNGVGQHYPLIQITRDVYEQKYQNTADQWEIPIEYVREGCIIRLFPTPDKAYEIVIKRLVALNDLSAINTTANIPQVWDEIIILGGIWRCAVDLGDLARGSYFKSLQAEMINTIIPMEVNETQSNSQLAHVEVPVLEY